MSQCICGEINARNCPVHQVIGDRTKRRDEAWENYKEANPPKGQAQFYYKDNHEYWLAGYDQGWADSRGRISRLEKALDLALFYVDYKVANSVVLKIQQILKGEE
jgi:hypothetical protein